jgi:hypothetical protein
MTYRPPRSPGKEAEAVKHHINRILATPALTRQELRCCAAYLWTGLRLARGDRDVAPV